MAETATIPAPAAPAAAHGPHRTSTGLSHNKIGMWLFLASDCLLFGALISTYLLYHDRISQLQLGPKEVFDIPFTSVSSFVLLMSSLTMVLALSALQRGDIARNRVWLLVTGVGRLGVDGARATETDERAPQIVECESRQPGGLTARLASLS